MKHISAAAALLLCLTLLTACGENSRTDNPEVTGTELTSGTELTTDLTTVSASETTVTQTEAGTSAPESDSTASNSQTESSAAASESTSASSAGTSASSASTTASTQKQAQLNLFEAAAPGKDCSAYIAANKPQAADKAPSCLGSGEDRTYTYADYEIKSYFENGKETVTSIDVTGKGIAAPGGLRIGMTTDDIERVHGEPETPGQYTYVTGDTAVEFLLEGDHKTIRLISYYLTVDPV